LSEYNIPLSLNQTFYHISLKIFSTSAIIIKAGIQLTNIKNMYHGLKVKAHITGANSTYAAKNIPKNTNVTFIAMLQNSIILFILSAI
jgi:hypothetical protein